MDFNDLKQSWQQSFKDERLSKEQIAKKLEIKGKSDIILRTVLRNNLFSLIMLLMMYLLIICGIFLFIHSNYAYLLSLLITALLGVGAAYSFRSYKQLKKTRTSNYDVKTALSKTIHIMEKSVRFGMSNLYRFFLIPLSLIMGIVIGLFIGAGERSVIETVYSLESKSIIKIILVVVFGSAITIPFSQFMMNKLYKQHLEELKGCLIELNEKET